MKQVTMKWAKENVSSINLIDVREIEEFKESHVEGSKNIPLTGFLMNTEQFINKKETYYIMCRSGNRSSNAIKALEDKGYNLVNVDGGILAL